MHIPDNYLSASTCAVLALATLPVWRRSVQKVSRDFPKERISALGVAAAFSFLAMMFNIPLPGGTTGHAVGGTVLAIFLGPEAACIALTIALAIQATLFGDGGVLAFGANCFNIAFVLPFSGYFVYRLLKKALKNDLVCVGVASYVGLNLAALTTAIEFGVQPLLFADETGQALYCPYPLSVAIPAMAVGHLTLFGLAESVFSVAIYSFVRKAAPNFSLEWTAKTASTPPNAPTDASKQTKINEKDVKNEFNASNILPQAESNASRPLRFGGLYLLLALLIALSPLGLLANGTAWGEWGADEIAEVVVDGQPLGKTPAGIENGFQWNAPVPDYSSTGLPDWFAYLLSATIGTALSIVLFKLVSAYFGGKRAVNR